MLFIIPKAVASSAHHQHHTIILSSTRIKKTNHPIFWPGFVSETATKVQPRWVPQSAERGNRFLCTLYEVICCMYDRSRHPLYFPDRDISSAHYHRTNVARRHRYQTVYACTLFTIQFLPNLTDPSSIRSCWWHCTRLFGYSGSWDHDPSVAGYRPRNC